MERPAARPDAKATASMKTSERHHLKQDQFASTLAETFERFDKDRNRWLAIGGAVLALLIAAGGYSWWRQNRAEQSSALLAEAQVVLDAPVVPPQPPPTPGQPAAPKVEPTPGSYSTERAKLEAALPKLTAAADAYPSTQAGLSARYQAASVLVALGRDADAAQRFQEVVDRDGSGLYGRMARLGLAGVQVRQGKFDPAIAIFKELSATAKDDLPVDGVLMALGRAYVAAGKKAEAGQTFKRISDEFPTSPYAADAKKELDAL
jgi:TolA-binding protein